jgi:hypothetical protein
MYNFYDDDSYGFIKDIEYVKGMYDAQVHKVKQEEYMRDLLFADYVRKVKCHVSRYDLIEKVFHEAHGQIGKKKKKEREQLTVIEDFVRDDFLNNDKNFKLTNIVSGGYDSYYWQVHFEGWGQKFAIVIPNMNRINVNNIKSAYDGMFVFEIQESEHCWSVKKMSYKIEDVAEYIKSYFGLDKVNEDEY